MGCGCNKRNQRRAQVVKVSGPRTSSSGEIKLNDTKVSMQSNKMRESKLNQGGVNAEKRKIQALRRNEILKKLGKR